MRELRPASTARVVLAFAAVYLVWGSTYLAIRVGVRTIPPLLMASARFLLAGTLLYGFARLRGVPRPTRSEWRGTATMGALLLLGGNGGLVLAERTVPSGVAALLVATTAVWMVLLDWLRPGGNRPAPIVAVGLLLGLAGIGLLVGPGSFGGGAVDPVGAGTLLAGMACWATGSVYSRRLDLPRHLALGAGMEMLAGGTLLAAAAVLHGELAALHPGAIAPASLGATLYLALVGSLVGFTAYSWLLEHAPPARVATYAYVNPVIAVLLGWLVLGEALTPRMLAAAAVIVTAVILITTARARRRPAPERAPADLGEEAA